MGDVAASNGGLLDIVTQTGMAGIIFIIWYVDQRKIQGLQRVIEEQVEDKKVIRATAQRYIDEMKEHSASLIKLIKAGAVREERTQEALRQNSIAMKANTSVLTKLDAKM